MSWFDEKSDVLSQITDAVSRTRAEHHGPSKGHIDNPWEAFVPQWVADIAEQQGETIQQVADRELARWGAVNVVIVPPL